MLAISAAIQNQQLPFWPTKISSIIGWFKGDGIYDLNGSLVETWKDESGNAYDITAAGADRPTLVLDVLNGKPCVRFDGSNTKLTVPSDFYTLSEGANSIFCVAKRDTEDGSIDTLFGKSVGGVNRYFLIYNAASGSVTFRNSTSGADNLTVTGVTNTDTNIIEAGRDGTNQYISINGGARSTNTGGKNVTGVDAAYAGAAGSGTLLFDGDFYEMIICNAQCTEDESEHIVKYLNWKYKLN